MRFTWLLKWKHRSTKPTMTARIGWKAGPSRGRLTPFAKRQLRGIALHHQGAGYNSVNSVASEANIMRGIQRFHKVDRGWKDMAYNYVIFSSGRIYEGRGLYRSGANGNGVLNAGYIAICFAGNYMVGQPSEAALKSCAALVDWLQSVYPQACKVTSHGKLKSTGCPGPALTQFAIELDKNDYCEGTHA